MQNLRLKKPMLGHFTDYRTCRFTSLSSRSLYKNRSRLDLRKYAFSNRVVDHWNALSDACVTGNTINQFKNCLKRELQPETHS